VSSAGWRRRTCSFLASVRVVAFPHPNQGRSVPKEPTGYQSPVMWLWFRNAPKLRLHRSFTAAHPPMEAEVAPARNGCQHPFSVPATRPTLEERPGKDPFQLATTGNQNWIMTPCPGAPKPGQARSQHDVVA
jgi:hypothetical protein